MAMKQVATELIGTFVLIFAATATPIVNEKTGDQSLC